MTRVCSFTAEGRGMALLYREKKTSLAPYIIRGPPRDTRASESSRGSHTVVLAKRLSRQTAWQMVVTEVAAPHREDLPEYPAGGQHLEKSSRGFPASAASSLAMWSKCTYSPYPTTHTSHPAQQMRRQSRTSHRGEDGKGCGGQERLQGREICSLCTPTC